MNKKVCIVSVASIKFEPNHKSEMMSQLLFGTVVSILEEYNALWVKIETLHKDTQGWMLSSQLAPLFNNNPDNFLQIKNHNTFVIKNSVSIPLMAGSFIPNDSLFDINNEKYLVKADNENNNFDAEAFLKSYLYAPYFWSGLTLAGIDCSGLSKIFYSLQHIYLPHFAAQQMEYGNVVDFLQHAKIGDLAFFINNENEINHVGILINDKEIIHSSESNGGVAIDWIDHQGILSKRTWQRTHTLRVIKRLLP